MHFRTRLLTAPALALALLGTPLALAPATAVPAPPTSPAATARAATGAWQPRPVQYPGVVKRTNLAIPMSDGTVLYGDLLLPADADKHAVPGRFPVIVTITAYNKDVQQYAGGLAGGNPDYLVQRGYAQLTVDARGTGSSQGIWCAFCTREDKDSAEVMTWAHKQPWSNGDTAMAGPSYMGINQIFAAAGRPPGLKAIFPQVPAGDVYRDVVASGGQLDVGFIPLWLGLVTFTGIIPPMTPNATALSIYLKALVDHSQGATSFTAPLLAKAALGQEPAYDGPFYAQRSPINVISKVDVPTFLISGEYDLFQRGTPLLFENLDERHVPVRMIIGPWNHLQASGGALVKDAGLGSLDELKLRWFDHYVKGMPDPGLATDIPPITYYEQGTGAWRTTQHWVGSDRRAVTYHLSGSSTPSTAGGLTTGPGTDGTSSVYPIPVAGLCTRSTDQWTAGASSEIPLANPCLTNNATNDRTGVVFETRPVGRAVRFQGPIDAHLFVSSSSGDGMLSVAVEDEAPDGTVSRLTGGWQVISLRALDKARSRYLDGRLIQPYHPFTKASQHKLAPGQVAPVDVEVFPTGASIQPGHRLRIAVQAFDVPHLLPTLAEAPGTLAVMTIHAGAQYPSSLTLPAVRRR
ncbi:CocE/NonD family hydrolase [Nocardioides terrisoli]|uniref:CocE/NonD family hydrolase n=1 Tax=Nocardioides terrisoli TaxID=3388267 RepID=UPI00287BA456|nr:CocE/NonD family hydrolase [Nocardioides marmorisolisilvae]